MISGSQNHTSSWSARSGQWGPRHSRAWSWKPRIPCRTAWDRYNRSWRRVPSLGHSSAPGRIRAGPSFSPGWSSRRCRTRWSWRSQGGRGLSWRTPHWGRCSVGLRGRKSPMMGRASQPHWSRRAASWRWGIEQTLLCDPLNLTERPQSSVTEPQKKSYCRKTISTSRFRKSDKPTVEQEKEDEYTWEGDNVFDVKALGSELGNGVIQRLDGRRDLLVCWLLTCCRPISPSQRHRPERSPWLLSSFHIHANYHYHEFIVSTNSISWS